MWDQFNATDGEKTALRAAILSRILDALQAHHQLLGIADLAEKVWQQGQMDLTRTRMEELTHQLQEMNQGQALLQKIKPLNSGS
jgi:hypothetical protein